MLNILIQKTKEQFLSVVYYFVGLFFYAWMIVGLYPSIKNIKSTYLEQMPENLIKFFGGDALALSTFSGFISLEFLSLFYILITSFYVASSAGSTIAGAIEKKTLDFQLSQPISRTKLLLSESIVSLFYSLSLSFLTGFSILVFCKIYHITTNKHGLLAFSIVATAFLWSVYGIAIFISSLLKSKIAVAASTVSIVMAFYVLTAMTNIIDKLKNFDKFSLFYAYNPQKLLETGTISWTQTSALLIVFLVGLFLSLIIFNKKDV